MVNWYFIEIKGKAICTSVINLGIEKNAIESMRMIDVDHYVGIINSHVRHKIDWKSFPKEMYTIKLIKSNVQW